MASPARQERLDAATEQAARDAELVRRFNEEGDEAAFAEIVTTYREKMRAIAYAMLRNADDAEEIAQDTFIRAHRGLKNFRGDSSLATWLHRVTQNLARNRYWYFFRRRRHATLSLDGRISDDSQATLSDLIPAETADPSRETTNEEFAELVTVCMDRLAPPHREILTLRNLLHRSYEDIGRALGINVGTVKSRIARARGNLLSLMADQCPEFETQDASAWLEMPREQSRALTRH